MQIISNDKLTVRISSLGAELRSIVSNNNKREYIWQADSAFWAKSSPVLFPIVGSLNNGEYRVEEKTYSLSRHGFARDREFSVLEHQKDRVCYRLESDENSLKCYPYSFILEIEYVLSDNNLRVIWRVKNISDKTMYFQIGGHPAFNYESYDPDAEIQAYLKMEGRKAYTELINTTIGHATGCAKSREVLKGVEEDLLPIKKDTFKNDAIVLENSKINNITILNQNKEPYLSVKFDAPVFGLWSPRKTEYAPFVCIEPWYGRTDTEGFTGDFSGKDWIQSIHSGEIFERYYEVIIL